MKGINNPIKRRKILTPLSSLRCDIAFLQETHLTDEETQKPQKSWVGKVFYSAYNSKARGVATLIHKSLKSEQIAEYKDKEGRYVIARIKIEILDNGVVDFYNNLQPILQARLARKN